MRVLATILFAALFATMARAQAPAQIYGDYVEARSGHVYTCGCLYSGETVTGGKEAILVWRVTGGSYQGQSLEGVKVAAVVVGESHLGAGNGPRQTALYLDGITSDAQRQAILELWRREYANVLGRIASARIAPIRFEREGEAWVIRIPDIAELRLRKARIPEDAHLGSSLWYGPLASLKDSTLATALHYEYWGLDFARQWREMIPSISGYLGQFAF